VIEQASDPEVVADVIRGTRPHARTTVRQRPTITPRQPMVVLPIMPFHRLRDSACDTIRTAGKFQ
jgi:hypothetical protein